MAKFMYLFRGGDARLAQESPEAMQAHMQKWGAWMGGLSEKGILLAGEPLDQGGKMVLSGGSVVTDGPYAEGKEVVGGYLIVNADSIDQAVEFSKECPIFEYEGTVEVRGIQDMSMEAPSN